MACSRAITPAMAFKAGCGWPCRLPAPARAGLYSRKDSSALHSAGLGVHAGVQSDAGVEPETALAIRDAGPDAGADADADADAGAGKRGGRDGRTAFAVRRG